MGGACSSRSDNENEPEVTCEGLCSAVESKLGLYKIEATKLETVLDEVCYENKAIDFQVLSDVFVRFEIPRSEFLSKESPFTVFYGGLVGNLEDDKCYVLCTSLPFCKGNLSEKKNILWRCLETTDKNNIYYNELIGVLKMLIVIPVKIIPEMIDYNDFQVIDKDLKTLLDSTEEDIDDYSKKYFPEKPQNGTTMHKHEFDEWFLKPEIEDLFSSKQHRKSFITYLNLKNEANQ